MMFANADRRGAEYLSALTDGLGLVLSAAEEINRIVGTVPADVDDIRTVQNNATISPRSSGTVSSTSRWRPHPA